MVISRTKNFIFLAYWKTGSTSIENLLQAYANHHYTRWLRLKYKMIYRGRGTAFKHMPATRCIRLVGQRTWDRCFTFAFARNPWDRAVSGYVRHFHRPDLDPREGFTEFIQNGARPWIRKWQLAEFVSDTKGDIAVDFIGRVENLSEDLKHVGKTLGISVAELPHLNRSVKRAKYREYYTDQTKRIVADWSKRDIELFGYEF